MHESNDTPSQPARGVPLWVTLALVAVLAVTLATILFCVSGGASQWPLLGRFRDPFEPLLIIDTRTPAPAPGPPATQTRSAAPTPATAATTTTRTPLPTPMAAATATAIPTHTPTATLATTPTSTPYVVVIGDTVRLRAGPGQVYDVMGFVHRGDVLPLVARTENGEWVQVSTGDRLVWISALLAQAQAGADQVPVASQIPPTPIPIPAPVLVDPPGGARFHDKVRFTFTWFRDLRNDERVSIYIRSANGVDRFDWRASKADVLAGGGAIRAQGGALVYEINSGLGSLPPGEAFWRIAIFRDTPWDKRQISPWSQERQIYKR